MPASPAAASEAAIAEPTPPLPTTSARAPAIGRPLRSTPRAKPAPSNMSPSSVPSARRRIALQEPATLTVVVTSSSKPTVVTLCGMVTRAPRMLVSRNRSGRKVG